MQAVHACAPTRHDLPQSSPVVRKYDPSLIATLAKDYGDELRTSLSAYTVVSWVQGILLGMKGADPQLKGTHHHSAVEQIIAQLKLGPVPAQWYKAFGVLEASRLWLLSWFGLVGLTTDRVWPMLQPSFSQMSAALQDDVVPVAVGWKADKWGRIKTAGEVVYETVYKQWRDAADDAATLGTAQAATKASGILLVLHLVVHYVGVLTPDALWREWPGDPPPELLTLAWGPRSVEPRVVQAKLL
jgi:hypothetical protein